MAIEVTTDLNLVGTSQIVDGSVTSAKIADGSVTSSKISTGAVNISSINSGSATSGQILQANGSGGASFLTLPVDKSYWVEITGALAGSSLGITDQAYVVQNVDSAQTDITIGGTRADFTSYSTRRITSLSNLGSVGDNGGVAWSTISTGIATTRNAACIEYGGSSYVIGASAGVLMTSPDGTTWTSRTSGFTNTIEDAVYGNSLWVIVGSDGKISTSTDAVTWTSRTSGFGANSIYAVDYNGSRYVAVGASGTISTSTDGTSWSTTASNFSTSDIYDVVYADGKFVAVGASGKIDTSTDGITWTSRTSNTAQTLYSVAYGNGYFLAIGASALVRSIDGSSWTSIGSRTGYAIAYGNNTFLHGASTSNLLYTSSDNGSTWVTRTPAVRGTTNDIIYANGAFWTVSDQGVLVKSTVQNKNVLFSPIIYSTAS